MDEHWLVRGVMAARTRYVHGSPQEDERTRHGRAGGGLMVLAATCSLALLPVLPPDIDQPLAFLLALGCLMLGLVIAWLPWGRWPRWTLLTPVAVTLSVVFGAGGMVDGNDGTGSGGSCLCRDAITVPAPADRPRVLSSPRRHHRGAAAPRGRLGPLRRALPEGPRR